jgi:hypothetical protein
MNTQEIILDFLTWFVRHKEDIFDLVDHPEATVEEYLEMLQAVEDLNDDNQLKLDL